MKRNNQGFSLYLTFLVTTIIFILVAGSYEVSRISLDLSRSTADDVILYHAADGGLERGLARTRTNFRPFKFAYQSRLQKNRRLHVEVIAEALNNTMNITAHATLFEGNRAVATKSLKRIAIKRMPARTGIGNFMEAS